MSIKLIIFDFDGTLGDTRRNIVVTMQDVMKELSLPLQDEDVCASTIGLPLKGCYAKMFPQLNADELERCAEVHHRYFAENLKKITPLPFPQVLCDSSDISYVFEDENGMINIPNEMDYYGEHSFQMQYKDTIGEPFDWLYIDADTLKENAAKNGYIAEIVAEGEHYDYLARITKMNER